MISVLKINDKEYNVIAATVEKKFKDTEYFEGVPLIPFEEIEKYYSIDSFEILISIGYKDMNQIRKKIFEICKKKNIIIVVQKN